MRIRAGAATYRLLLLATVSGSLHGMSLIDESFEQGTLNGTEWTRSLEGDRSRMSLSSTTDPVRSGSKAMKLTIDVPNTDFSILRNELQLRNPNPSIGETNTAYTYTFSHFIPNNWPTSPLPIEVAQFHVPGDPGEVGRGPVLAFTIVNGEYKIALRWDDEPFSTADDIRRENKKALYYAPLTKGSWTDWRVDVRWSWGDPREAPGTLRIWKNGSVIVDRVGPNCFNDQSPRYFKWGLYTRSSWTDDPFKAATYTIYIDEMSVATLESRARVGASVHLDMTNRNSDVFKLTVANAPSSASDIAHVILSSTGLKFDYFPPYNDVQVEPTQALAINSDGLFDHRASLEFTKPINPGAIRILTGGDMDPDSGSDSLDDICVHVFFRNGRTLGGRMAKQVGESWVFTGSE